MHHIRRLPTIELIDQVDERNNMIEELLRMGEATISGSVDDPSPLSKQSYTESQDGESPKKRSWENWENLDLAADGVLKSLGRQLNAIAELSDHSTSSSTRSEISEDESESIDSNTSQDTIIYTGVSHGDEQEEVQVKTLDSFEDEELVVHKKCIVGHDLKPHRTPSNRWWCSKCSKQVSEGTRLFGCRICNYDECWSCVSAARAKVKCKCDSATSTSSAEVLLEEVASLKQQMSVVRDQLHGVRQAHDVESAKNRRFQVAIAMRLWRAIWSEVCN